MHNNNYYSISIFFFFFIVFSCKKNISSENNSTDNIIMPSTNADVRENKENDHQNSSIIEDLRPQVTGEWGNNEKLLHSILAGSLSNAGKEAELTMLVGELCAHGFTQQTLDWINDNIGAGNTRNNLIASAINMSSDSIADLFVNIKNMPYEDERSSGYHAMQMKLSRMPLEELNSLAKDTDILSKHNNILGSALATKIDRMGLNNHSGDDFLVASGIIKNLLELKSKQAPSFIKGFIENSHGESFNTLWSAYESHATSISKDAKKLIMEKSAEIQPEVTLNWISKQDDNPLNNQYIRNSIHHLLLTNTDEAMNVIVKNPYNFSAIELDNARYQIIFYALSHKEYNTANELSKSLTSPEVMKEARNLINKMK